LKFTSLRNSSTRYSKDTLYSVCRTLDLGPAFVEQKMHERGHVDMGRT